MSVENNNNNNNNSISDPSQSNNQYIENVNKENNENTSEIRSDENDPFYLDSLNHDLTLPNSNRIENNKNQENIAICNSQSDAIQALLKRTGYPLVQENGQRKYGPPPNWGSTPQPDRGCEAFIGKIPRDCFEDEIIPLLEKIGRVYEFRLMMEYSGFNRGYGFVMFFSREEAKNVLSN